MTQKLIDLPAELINKLAAMGHTATIEEREFMSEMANREREPKMLETDVESFPNRKGLSEIAAKKEALGFFKKLEAFECGRVLLGRRKQKTRIRWLPYGAKAVARAFLSEFGPSAETDRRNSDTPDAPTSTDAQPYFHQHSFLLRPDLQISFSLPLDLSKDEANRLAEFIRSIPF